MGDHVHDIFVNLHIVCGFDQRAIGKAKLMLGGGDFMMMLVAM